MDLKNINFCICQKEKTIFITTLLSSQMHPLSENNLGVPFSFLIMGYVYKDKFPVPLKRRKRNKQIISSLVDFMTGTFYIVILFTKRFHGSADFAFQTRS